MSLAIEEQFLAVPAPVWSFHSAGSCRHNHRAPEIIFDADRLQRAEVNRLPSCFGGCAELDIAKRCGFHHVGVMRTHPDSGVEGPFQMQFDRCAHLVQRFPVVAQKHRDRIAAFFQPDLPGRLDVQFDILRGSALFAPILQGSHTRAMLRRIDIDTVCIKRLAKHQQRFAMRTGIARRRRKRHFGGQR